MAIIESQYHQSLQTPLLLGMIFLATCYYYSCCFWSRSRRGKHDQKKSSLPTNWPVVGMMPGLLQNAHRIQDYATEILKESGGTFEFKGPWFVPNMNMLLTSDPSNIHHVLSKNFSNYPKGPEFRKIFDILGDGIFNADSELWEIHRKVTLSVMHHPNFQELLERTVWEKVERGLLPILEKHEKIGAQIDLQDVFQRFTFDNISKLVLDKDAGSLSMDFPTIPCEKAFNDTVEALLYRHILPEGFWKLQKWLGVGKERKLSRAWDDFDQFIYPCIAERIQHLPKMATIGSGEFNNRIDACLSRINSDNFDGLTAFIEAYKGATTNAKVTKQFLRDVFLNLMLAGRDTTSTALAWLFFLIATNPSVESKILEEIETKLDNKFPFKVEESHKLVYLHGALCESLRLFPPVALEHKAPVKADILPSGHSIDANAKLILVFYSMGRMESIWGEDCMDFKPERWISERGRAKHEPSFKFPAFNAGPRTCLGKEMAFVQMKMVTASIISHYHVQLVDDDAHPISPSDSIIIQMKHGFMVRLLKRNSMQ